MSLRTLGTLALLAALATANANANANANADADAPFIVGVATHSMNNTGQPLRSLQMASAAGVTSVRDDAFWSTAEPTAGQLQIVAPWRAWLSTARALDLAPMVILGYGTSFQGNAKPRKPEVRIPYLKYVDYITRQLGNPVKFYEVWNEWDIEGPGDARLSTDYASLVRDVAPVIRKNNPQAVILAGAVTTLGITSGFVDRIIAAGVMKYADGLSLHPYVHCYGIDRNTPESWIGCAPLPDGDELAKSRRQLRDQSGTPSCLSGPGVFPHSNPAQRQGHVVVRLDQRW